MMSLNKKVYETLYNNCNPNKFAMNDTGDGYLCVFWDKLHALTCLDMAIRIQEFLDSNLPRHNKSLKRLKRKKDIPEFDYGFAIHSGGCTIKRTTYTNGSITIYKDFIFGIVANTVARLESFTKNYVNFKFLVTGHYKDIYLNQSKYRNLRDLFGDRSYYVNKSLGRVNLKDDKATGHFVYGLKEEFIAEFKKYYIR